MLQNMSHRTGRTAILFSLAACSYPHYPAAPRTHDRAHQLAITVETNCAEDPINESIFAKHAPWDRGSVASGVILDEKHAVTAAHAVRCPGIPTVRVTTSTGEHLLAVVDRDEAAFGDGHDVARLVLLGAADRFNLAAAPPLVGRRDGLACEDVSSGWACGVLVPWNRPWGADYGLPAHAVHGDSGSGVYDSEGGLVGIIGPQYQGLDGVVRVPASYF